MIKAPKLFMTLSIVLFWGLSSAIFAQKPSSAIKILLPLPKDSMHNFHFERILPHYVQQNPQDLAPLCKLELKIEKQSPIGMWLRIDDQACRSFNSGGLAYFRFRLKL